MPVQFKERECGYHTVVFNGYGYVKDDIGNYKDPRYEQMFKLIARTINECVLEIIENHPWLGDITTKRYMKEIRCYNYPMSIWAGRASHQWNGKSVLKINLAHIFAGVQAGINPKQRIRELVDHESAHIFYRYRPEFSNEWHKFVSEVVGSVPIDDYSDEYQDKWDSELFSNEIHSIMSEFLIAQKDLAHCTNMKAFQQYKEKYIEMHA